MTNKSREPPLGHYLFVLGPRRSALVCVVAIIGVPVLVIRLGIGAAVVAVWAWLCSPSDRRSNFTAETGLQRCSAAAFFERRRLMFSECFYHLARLFGMLALGAGGPSPPAQADLRKSESVT